MSNNLANNQKSTLSPNASPYTPAGFRGRYQQQQHQQQHTHWQGGGYASVVIGEAAPDPSGVSVGDILAGSAEEAFPQKLAEKKTQYVRDPRPHFSVVFCGHVDAGKSTILRCLMLDSAGAAGYFETMHRRITSTLFPRRIGGAPQAEVCVLVISARRGEFESGFDKNGPTREHVLLVRTCGAKHMICVINKMDECNWEQRRYDEILGRLKPLLNGNDYDEKAGTLVIMPVAGLVGTNINAPIDSSVCPWYSGPHLIGYIDNLQLLDARKEDDVLAVPLVGAYKNDGKMYVYGKVESGSIVIGDTLQILPSKTECTVEGITIENTELDKAYPGDNVHIRVKGVYENDVNRGFVLTSNPTSLKAVEYIQARVMVLEVRNILSASSKLMMHLHAAQVEVTIHKILATMDRKTGEVIKKEPKFVKAGDTMMVRLELERPQVAAVHTDFDKLARFILRDNDKTIALGIVTKLYESTKKSQEGS